MTLEDFIDKFAFAIEVEPATLQGDTPFKSLEVWDSLNTLSLIAMADADYDVALSGDDIQASETVADVWRLVESRKK